jgi:hypothetical protein
MLYRSFASGLFFEQNIYQIKHVIKHLFFVNLFSPAYVHHREHRVVVLLILEAVAQETQVVQPQWNDPHRIPLNF